MPGLRDVIDRLARVVDDQGVRRGQQRHGCGGLVLAGVPGDAAGGLDGHVGCDGVGSVVEAAGRDDVDGRRRDGQRGVVPDEGDVLAYLVVCLVVRARGDHRDAARGESRIDRDGRGRASGGS